MLKKVIIPLIFVAEWILYFYVLLLVLAYNFINLANVLYVDTPGEVPITITTSTSVFIQSLLLVLSLCVICFLYTKYFTGKGFFKLFKAYAWAILFALNSVRSFGYFLIWYGVDGFDLRNTELILLLLIILASVTLTMHIVRKLINNLISQ